MSTRGKKGMRRTVCAVVMVVLAMVSVGELKGETAFENIPVVVRPGPEAFPAIWGNYIVWKMAENEAYDIAQGKIVEMPGLVITGVPDIWANKVVWSDANGYYDMDLQQMVYPEGLSVGEWPAIHANRIVWSDSNGYYDLEAGQMVYPPGPSIGSDPDIFEEKIVWDNSTGYYDIGLRQMVFPEGGAIGNSPAIYDDKVVWNHLGGYYDIELQEYVGGAGGRIGMRPDIFEDTIVSHNYDAVPPIVVDVLVWDPVCRVRGVTDSGSATFPRVYDGTIVWMDKRNGDADIYMAKVIGCCGDAEHPYPEGDLNHDCRVNILDLAILASHWLECTAPECGLQVTDVKIIRGELVEGRFQEIEEVDKLIVGHVFAIYVNVYNFGHVTEHVFGCGYSWDLSPQNHVKVIGSFCPPGGAICKIRPGESAVLVPFCSLRSFKAEQAGWVTMNIRVRRWIGAGQSKFCEYIFRFEILPSE